MTDVIRAFEATIAAGTQIEVRFDKALRRMFFLNTRMIELYSALKSNQPVRSGTVCLELYPCGHGCAGCPHPRWVKYTWTRPTANMPAMLRSLNLDAKGINPSHALPKTLGTREHVLEIICDAKAVLKERSTLLKLMRRFQNFEGAK